MKTSKFRHIERRLRKFGKSDNKAAARHYRKQHKIAQRAVNETAA